MYQWNKLKSEFENDGSLRDIYALDTNADSWSLFLDNLRLSNYKFEFKHGDEVLNLPSNYTSIRKLQEVNPTTLTIWLSEIRVNCHFFVESEIEMDISPAEINSKENFKELMAFITWFSYSLQVDVVLTHENAKDFEIIRVEKKFI
ncbi:hypothetical protein [Pseudoalteromonas sp. SaAl2]